VNARAGIHEKNIDTPLQAVQFVDERQLPRLIEVGELLHAGTSGNDEHVSFTVTMTSSSSRIP
jgi:hypothetical protein